MRAVGYLIVASIAVALLQRVVAVLLIALIALVFWGVITKPAETFGLLCFGLLTSLLEQHPWAGVTVIGLFTAAVILLPNADDS